MLQPLDDRAVDAVLSEPARSDDQPPPRPRLQSLDALRGLTVLGMLVVNNMVLGSETPDQLRHADWSEGVHMADLVFPWFLLIVGLAIPFSAASYHRRRLPDWRYTLRILTRCAALFALGCFVDSSLQGEPVIGMGVLQLIGCAYAVAALLHGSPFDRRLIVAAGLLLIHWALLRFVPAPGAEGAELTQDQNIIRHLNDLYLQPLHLRGILSVVPTSALVVIGTVLGDVLASDAAPRIRKAEVLLAGGLVMVAVGWAWSFDLPFNKAIWSSPYILYTGGWAAVAGGVLFLIMDIKGWRAWAYPLRVFGSNAIVAYVAPILLKAYVLYSWELTDLDGSQVSLYHWLRQWYIDTAGPIAGGWIYTGIYVFVCWMVLWALYRRRLFLRV